MVSMTLQRSERVGSQLPTWRALPSDGCDNGSGDDAIELALLAGLDLDEWQRLVLRDSLLVRADDPDRWAALTVWLAVGRQNGKGSILEARQLAGLALFGSRLAVHTAHELKTTQEHFLRMQQLIEGCADVERMVLRIRTGKGDEAIEMKNGNRLRFIARSTGGGRGFSADDLYLDESMFVGEGMMRAIFSTMAARSKAGNPQLWLTGSAPKADEPNQAWAHGQVGILRGDKRPDRSLYLDFGTLPPTLEEVDAAGGVDAAVALLVDDRDRWYGSNPSLGTRIGEEFCETERSTLGVWGFAVERLGLVIPPEVTENLSGVDIDAWAKLAGEFTLNDAPTRVVGVDLNESGGAGTVTAAGVVGGRACLEVVATGGVGSLVEWITRQDQGVIGAVVVDESSHARMLSKLLTPDGSTSPLVPVVGRSSTEAAEDHALFVLSVASGEFVHRGDARVRAAILAAAQRPMGERWKWSPRHSSGDITALRSAALALANVSAAGVHDPNEVFVH